MDTKKLLALGLAQIVSEKQEQLDLLNEQEKYFHQLNTQLNSAVEEKERTSFLEDSPLT